MKTQIKTYYIPNNPNILQGTIYNLYINNNTNLDLSSIIFSKTTQEISNPSSKVNISESDYNRLLELNTLSFQLVSKKNTDLQDFIREDSKTTSKLIKVNQEREDLIKRLTKGKEVAK